MKRNRVEVRCSECNDPYFVQPSRVGVKLYCSPECGLRGGSRKRSKWGITNRVSDQYKKSQSERTRKSWTDQNKRDNHEKAMRTPEYIALRSENMKRITASDNWKEAIRQYAVSDRKKENMAKRRAPACPNWTGYTAPDGKAHKFRSKWECALAHYMDRLGLSWQYEPRNFVLDDGSMYRPDFIVITPFGICYVECHRIEKPKPGDERKVARLHRIKTEGLLDFPLVLLGESDMNKLIRR